MERARISLLTVCGLEELDGHSQNRVTHVLSILDPGWPDPPGLAGWEPHHRLTLRFHDIIEPVADQIMPQPEHVSEILGFADTIEADAGERTDGHLLIHCHMGISRSTAAMTMLLAQAYPDETEADIVERLVAIRPQAWPNLRMIGFADELLSRNGRLTAEVSRLHGRQMAEKPHLAEVFRRLGRAHEVERALQAAA